MLSNIAIVALSTRGKRAAPVYREAFVSLVLDSIDAAITVYGSEGKLLRVNKGAEALSGDSETELQDLKVWRDILPGTDLNGSRPLSLAVGPTSIRSSTRVAGSVAAARGACCAGQKGCIALNVCIGFDIAAQRRFEVDLIAAKNDVKVSRRYGGTGLGLATTKKLVDAHGSRIAVTNSPNQGTTVTIAFPARRSLRH